MEDHEREETEGMNMQENARLVLGLRAAGWDEKKINDFFFTSRQEKNSISPSRIKTNNQHEEESRSEMGGFSVCQSLNFY